MRHGRKSSTHLIDGDTRHVPRDLDSALIRVAGVMRAKAPAASVTDARVADVAPPQVTPRELHIDRAYPIRAAPWCSSVPPR